MPGGQCDRMYGSTDTNCNGRMGNIFLGCWSGDLCAIFAAKVEDEDKEKVKWGTREIGCTKYGQLEVNGLTEELQSEQS